MTDVDGLFQAFASAADWTLDVAAGLARHYPEEVATVERVRRFLRARRAGLPAHVRVDEVLFVFALVVGAVERDLGPHLPHARRFASPPWDSLAHTPLAFSARA